MHRYWRYSLRNKGVFITVFFTVIALFVVLAYQIPNTFKSSATLVYSAPDLDPEEMVRASGKRGTDYDIAEQIAASTARVLTMENLRELVRTAFIENNSTEDTVEIDTLALSLKENIHVSTMQSIPGNGHSTFGFTVTYTHPNRTLALKVVNFIVDLYLSDNIVEGTRSLTVALNLLKEESNRLQGVINRLGKKIASFKRINSASLPELRQYNVTHLSDLMQDLARLDRETVESAKRRQEMKGSLASTRPDNYIYTQDDKRLYTPSEQLELLQAEYVSLKKVYSATHPDMVSLKRKIEALNGYVEQQDSVNSDMTTALNLKTASELQTNMAITAHKEALSSNNIRKGSGDGSKSSPAVRASNPNYLRLIEELAAEERIEENLYEQKKVLEQSISDHRLMMAREPNVARQLDEMLTIHNKSLERLSDIEDRYFETQLALAVAESGGGSRFILAESPQAPVFANSRKRYLMMLLGLLLAIAFATIIAMIRGSRNDLIYDIEDIKTISGKQSVLLIPDYKKSKQLLVS